MIKVNVTTHSGDNDIMFVKEVNIDLITELRNKDNIIAIKIGNISYSRIDIKTVKIIEETPSEKELPIEEPPTEEESIEEEALADEKQLMIEEPINSEV